MSFTAKTAFQPRMWNNRHNDLQNVAGEFGAMVSETGRLPTAAPVCSA